VSGFPGAAREIVGRMTAEAAAAPARAVAFQGAPGCNSHSAAFTVFPECLPLPCYSFEEALDAVSAGRAGRAVIPIENSLHGRVADIHFLLPESGLHIVGEYFHPIAHCLVGVGERAAVREVRSHPQALGQCRRTLRACDLSPVTHADTAAAAAEVADLADPAVAALAPPLSAEIYGLRILEPQMSDSSDNVTRFVTLSAAPGAMEGDAPWVTTLLFSLRSVPAALFKALGGFATNGVNLTKLESYHRPGTFVATEFYCDIAGHPGDPAVARAIDELEFHSDWVRILGSYPSAIDRSL
jgi:prephenate dehydratase